jgi:hypothetical protein
VAKPRPVGARDVVKRTEGSVPAVDYQSELLSLVEAANQGEEGALARLHSFLDSHPEVWETVGNLAKVAERYWIDLVVGQEFLASESVTRYVEKLRADLLGPEPTRMERVLVDEVVASYLAARHADLMAGQPGNCSVALATLRYRRCESAQRRHQRALKNLAILRAKAPEGLVPLSAGGDAARGKKELGKRKTAAKRNSAH